MTLHIPLRLVLFVLYTVALLGGSAGIAVGITQTVEGPRGEQGEPGPRGLAGPAGVAGQDDSTACHIAIRDYSEILAETITIALQGVASLPTSLQEKLDNVNADFARNC